jgi:WD40 repeat protein
MQLSPDAQRLATRERDQPLAIVWELATGREIARLDHHDLPIADLAWSPDGQRIATVSSDGELRIVDLAASSSVRKLSPGGALRSVAWSARGEELLVADAGGSVRLLGAEDGRELATLATHRGGVIAARFQPGGELVASAGADGRVRCSRRDGTAVVEHEVGRCVDLAWSPCGSWIRVRLTQPAAERLLVVDPGVPVPEALAGDRLLIWFADDGACAVLVPLVEKNALLWNRVTGAAKPLSVELGSNLCAIDSTRRLLAVVQRYDIRVIDLDLGHHLATLRGHLYNPSALALRDGVLVSGSLDRSVRLWQLEAYGSHLIRRPPECRGEDLAAIFPARSFAVFLPRPGAQAQAIIHDYRAARVHAALEPPPTKPNEVATCPSAGLLAIRCAEGVAVYDVDTGKRCSLVPRERIGAAQPIVMSPRGDQLLLQHWPGPIWFADPRTGEARASHELPTNAGRFAISSDGAWVAYAAGANFTRAGLWHVSSGRKLPLPDHSGTLIGFAFSPDGTKVVSAAVDGAVNVSEVATGRLLRSVAGLPVTTDPPFWSSDGRWISIGERVIATDTWFHALTLPRPTHSTFLGFAADATHIVRRDRGGRLRYLPLRPAEHLSDMFCPAPRLLDLQRLEIGAPEEREALARDSARNQPSAAVHHRDGVRALAAGELDRAIASLRRAVEIAPRRPARQIDLAVALARRARERPTTQGSDLEEALAAVRAALAVGGASAAPLLQRPELVELRRHPRWAKLEEPR